MKKLILLLSLIPIELYAQTTLQFGIPQNSYTAATVAVGNGTSYSLPATVANTLTWQISYGGAPTSITLLLQGSLDNSNWFTLDTSTNVSGEIRTIGTSVLFVRARISAASGGTAITVKLTIGRGSTSVSIINNLSPNQITAITGCAIPPYSFVNDTDSGFGSPANNQVCLQLNGNMDYRWTPSDYILASGQALSWSSSAHDANQSVDLSLVKVTADTLALRRSTNTQELQIGPDSDYLLLQKGIAEASILTKGLDHLNFGINDLSRWRVDGSTGHFYALGAYNIGDRGTNSPINISVEESIWYPATTPSSPTNGDTWIDTAAGNWTTAATTINLKARNNGTTRTIASVTF